MRTSIIIGVAALLGGCATSGASLGKRDLVEQWSSSKSPSDVAGCIALALNGDNSFVQQGASFVVLRKNGYGLPSVRYDIVPTASGSKIELRRAISINSGTDKVKACL